ncbi:hypothetical protein FM103_13145 [Corynebacterium xerosis]|nr:hypothetical protein FM103_13145 [Corynebacterium xerosis]
MRFRDGHPGTLAPKGAGAAAARPVCEGSRPRRPGRLRRGRRENPVRGGAGPSGPCEVRRQRPVGQQVDSGLVLRARHGPQECAIRIDDSLSPGACGWTRAGLQEPSEVGRRSSTAAGVVVIRPLRRRGCSDMMADTAVRGAASVGAPPRIRPPLSTTAPLLPRIDSNRSALEKRDDDVPSAACPHFRRLRPRSQLGVGLPPLPAYSRRTRRSAGAFEPRRLRRIRRRLLLRGSRQHPGGRLLQHPGR